MDYLLPRDKVFVAWLFITRNILSQCKYTSFTILFFFLLFLKPVLVFCACLCFFLISFDSPFVFCSRKFDVQRGVQHHIWMFQSLQPVLCVCLHTSPQDSSRLLFWGNFGLGKNMSLNLDDPTLPYRSVDDVLLEYDLSSLLSKSKNSNPVDSRVKSSSFTSNLSNCC